MSLSAGRRLVAVDVDLTDAVILDSDPNSGFAGSRVWLERAIDAGVLYVCPVDDGSCPVGHHQGGVFLHYCEGKDFDDFDRLLHRYIATRRAEGRE
jgi:hypothetical protein